jgi:alpha-L-fucosidase 2
VQYWLGGGGWLAQHLWWHYRYSMDETFLRDEAYPVMRDCMTFYAHVLERGEDGKLHVPLSSSPEYHSNHPPAWTADPTGDLAFIRNLSRWCVRASEILDADEPLRSKWRMIDRDLAPYPTSVRGLKVQPDTEFDKAHRHPTHLAPIFPLDDLNIEGSDDDRRLIDASLETWLAQGTDLWTGWSFPYASLICSRAGRAQDAYRFLDIYRKAFIWPNGFHINGDYKKLGYSKHAYEPFTVEAECAFTAAVNEMLLQSWGEKIRVFPAVPDGWPDVSFENLRAEGAVLVSARRQAGRLTRLRLRPEHDGQVTITWTPATGEPRREAIVPLTAGQTVTLVGEK